MVGPRRDIQTGNNEETNLREGPQLTTHLGQKAARGASVTGAGMLLRIGVQALGVVILARILVPADFGLVAMAVAIIGVGDLVRDFGLSYAAIQARGLSTKQRSNLFWLNTLFGALVGACVFALSWPIAYLYGDPRLVGITQAISVTFLINGIGSQYRASLQRAFAFTSLTIAEVIGQVTGVAAGIACAFLGFSYWSIVIQLITQPAAVVAVLIVASRWLPRGFYRNQQTRKFIRFGWHMMAFQLMTYASMNVDTVVIGLRFGATALGYYNRAFQFMAVPVIQLGNGLIRVAVPILARLQDDRDRLTQFLVRAHLCLFAVMFFLLALLGAMSEPAIRLLLGPEWADSAPILRILAFAGLFQTLTFPLEWAFVAQGLTRVNLLQALLARPILVISIVIGAQFSVQGAAWGYSVGAAISWPIALVALSRHSTLDTRQLISVSLRMLGVNVVAGSLGAIVVSLVNVETAWKAFALGAVVMTLSVLLTIAIFPSVRRDYKAVARSGVLIIRRRGRFGEVR